jgi:serine/threonine protein kinase
MMEKFEISLDRAIEIKEYREWIVNNAFEITIQLINRLQRLHSKGYIHGDIKPQNMCLQRH